MNSATARTPRPHRRPVPDAAIALTTIDFEPRPVLVFSPFDEDLRRRWERIARGDRA